MDEISDEVLQAILMGGGDIAAAQNEQNKAKQMAALIRGFTPSAQSYQAGRVVKAASPLEHIARVGGMLMEGQQINKGNAAADAASRAMTTQNQAVLAALLRKKKQQMAEPPSDSDMYQYVRDQ